MTVNLNNAAVSSPQPKIDDTVRFLRWLGRSEAQSVIFSLEPRPTLKDPDARTMAPHHVTSANLAAVLATSHAAGYNQYWEVATSRTTGKRATKADVVSTSFLHVDLDPADGERAAAACDRYFTLLENGFQGVPKPSAVYETGRGIQALWKLATPATPDQFDRVESINKWLTQQLGSKGGTHDVSRALRLPGTVNFLDAGKRANGHVPATSLLIDLNDAVYTFEDFGFDAAKTYKPTGAYEGPGYEVTAQPEKVESLDDLRCTTGIPMVTRHLISCGAPKSMAPHTRQMYEHDFGDRDKKDRGDRSAYVYQVACDLVRCGVPDSQILGVLTDEAWGISAHVLEQGDVTRCAERQVRRAHEAQAREAVNDNAQPEAPAFSFATDELIGAPRKVKKAVALWKEGKPFDDEQAVVDWLVKHLGHEKAEAVITAELGAKYLPLMPTLDAGGLDGNDLDALVEATAKGLPTIKSFEGELYLFEEGKYRIQTDLKIKQRIQTALSGYTVHSGRDRVGLYTSHITEIVNHFSRANDVSYSGDEVVLFRNGYLRDGKFYAPDDQIFAVGGPECNYDPKAQCPMWLEFLAEQWAKDPASIDLLQELFGLYMVDDISYQTCLIMTGESGSGKGTIIRILNRLIGDSFFCAFNVRALTGSFGLQGLLGKTVAAAADVRGPYDSGVNAAAREIILGIAGADAMSVNPKGKPIFSTQIRARLVMSFNELADARAMLLDGKGATARRVRALRSDFKTPEDAQDPTLTEKLATELAGIANWALVGLQRLRKQGFTMNEATQSLRNITKETNIKEFVDSQGIVFDKAIDTMAIYKQYADWAVACGEKPMAQRWFRSQLQDAALGVKYTDNPRACSGCKAKRRFFFRGDETAIEFSCNNCHESEKQKD